MAPSLISVQRTKLRQPVGVAGSGPRGSLPRILVNGDEPLASDGQLRQFYDSMVRDKHTGKQLESGLIVNTVSGRDDKWSASQDSNCTTRNKNPELPA